MKGIKHYSSQAIILDKKFSISLALYEEGLRPDQIAMAKAEMVREFAKVLLEYANRVEQNGL